MSKSRRSEGDQGDQGDFEPQFRGDLSVHESVARQFADIVFDYFAGNHLTNTNRSADQEKEDKARRCQNAPKLRSKVPLVPLLPLRWHRSEDADQPDHPDGQGGR